MSQLLITTYLVSVKTFKLMVSQPRGHTRHQWPHSRLRNGRSSLLSHWQGALKKKKYTRKSTYLKFLKEYPEILKPDLRLTPNLTSNMSSKPRRSLPQRQNKATTSRVRKGSQSALHLQPKSSGGLRLCGDFRDLNSKTVLASFPLPNLCHFTHKLKGSNTFSKVDLVKVFKSV